MSSCDFCGTDLRQEDKFCDHCGGAHRPQMARAPRGIGGVPMSAGPAAGPSRPAPSTASPAVPAPRTPPAPAGPATTVSQGSRPSPVAMGAALRLTLVHPTDADLAPLRIEPGHELGSRAGPHAAALRPFNDRGVSGRHCRFDWSSTSGWTVTDLSSSYGTELVNQPSFRHESLHPVTPTPHPCRSGALLRVGQLVFRIEVLS